VLVNSTVLDICNYIRSFTLCRPLNMKAMHGRRRLGPFGGGLGGEDASGGGPLG